MQGVSDRKKNKQKTRKMVIEEIDLFVLFDEIVNIKEMKKKNLFWLVSLLFVISLPHKCIFQFHFYKNNSFSFFE